MSASRYLSLAGSIGELEDGVRSSLDRLVEHCAHRFGAPMSLISIIEFERQRLLASIGTELAETPLAVSFCRHAVNLEQPLLVEDATLDPRFRENPLVLGPPNIRSYLGYPLRHPAGPVIGALCVIDKKPGSFTYDAIDELKTYAEIAQDLLRLQESHARNAALIATIGEQSKKLTNSHRILQQSERLAKIGSWEIDPQENRCEWSNGAPAILGLGQQALSLESFLSLCAPASRDALRGKFERAFECREDFRFETDITIPDNTTKHIKLTTEWIEDEGSSRLVGVIMDVSEAHQSRIALRHAAEHDSLTGLSNRYALDAHLRRCLSSQNDAEQVTFLLLIDLDGFKDVNDSFGHMVGDVILEEVSERIVALCPTEGMAARWGGDEFALVMPPGSNMEDALATGQALLDTLQYRSNITGQAIEISATIGIARGEIAASVKELVRRADTALYHGKKREPGTLHIYEPQMERVNTIRKASLEQVRTALREDRLFPGYQPIVEFDTGRIVGLEALMRFDTRSGRRMTAGEVLPALIDPIVSREVGASMIKQVAAQFNDLDAGLPALEFVSINTAESDLLSKSFVDTLLRTMDAWQVDLSRITLEVTETMLMIENADAMRNVLQDLKRRGVGIALDDFGTGCSSLTHLRDFPIDKVKIDGSFVQAIGRDRDAETIVHALIGMAANLGLGLIAEGIETEEQKECLRQMGCLHGQGFHFGPAEDHSRFSLKKMSRTAS